MKNKNNYDYLYYIALRANKIHMLVAAWVVRSKAATVRYFWMDNAQLPYLEAYNALFCFITHCFKWGSYLCVQSLSNLMQTFILTLQENIFDVHHLVDFPMTVDNMTVANVSHSASMTHSCMHHSTINFDSHHAACHAL